jgi:hypothetical protein
MKNFEYKYEKYYKKFINTNNIIKKMTYISKILYYKKNLINQVGGGGLFENREIQINKILDTIPLIINKVESFKKIYDLVLEHDNLTEFFDSNFSYYKNNDDLINYYDKIIINISNK